MIQTTTLDNGLQIATEAMPDVQSVGLSFWVGTGSRDETNDEWGMSHFLEHLLFKGSHTRSALEIAQAIDVAGGDMNAFTTKECTAFYVRVLADDVELALDIICDIMCNPAFNPVDIESERHVVLEEILMHNDEPSDLVHELFASSMFAGHSLAREILGDKAGIEIMKGQDIEGFFNRNYLSRNLVFAAAGRLSHDRIVEEVSRRFQGREGGNRPQRIAPQIATGVRSIHYRPTDQIHLIMGVPAPNRHQHDRYATSLLDVILGGGMSSRLFQEIREKRGLAYTVYSGFTPFDDAGEFGIYLGTSPRRVGEAVSVITEMLADVCANGVSEAELVNAKRHLRATTALGLEDSGARMSRIGRSLLLHGEILTIEEVRSRFESVTIDEVNQIASQVLTPQPVIAAVGPISEEELL